MAYGDIGPGDGSAPGQAEREFIVRGDAIGTNGVQVDFGGVLTGPGIPADDPIPFSGTAATSLEVRGPPRLAVDLRHPDSVVAGQLYDLEIKVTNTDDIPALYASLQLDMGFDAELLRCEIDATTRAPVCETLTGPELRNLGHLLPGEALTEVFKVRPLKSGAISSCMGAADQNITLRVAVGRIGCLIGEFPPGSADPTGAPAVSVLPTPNMSGVNVDSPVVAFFNKAMAAKQHHHRRGRLLQRLRRGRDANPRHAPLRCAQRPQRGGLAGAGWRDQPPGTQRQLHRGAVHGDPGRGGRRAGG